MNSANVFSCADCHPAGSGYALTNGQANLNALATQLVSYMATYSAAAGYPLCNTAAAGSAPSWKTRSPTTQLAVAGTGACPAGATYAAKPSFDKTMLKAAYNLAYIYGSDPYAWVHNYNYAADAIIDSMIDVEGSSATVLANLPIGANTVSTKNPTGVQLTRP